MTRLMTSYPNDYEEYEVLRWKMVVKSTLRDAMATPFLDEFMEVAMDMGHVVTVDDRYLGCRVDGLYDYWLPFTNSSPAEEITIMSVKYDFGNTPRFKINLRSYKTRYRAYVKSLDVWGLNNELPGV